MYDFAIFLCCFNNYRIYCLEYTCLIFSLLIFPFNILGIVKLKWNIIKFFCQIIYSINTTICAFAIFLISLVIYTTKLGKITTDELYKPFTSISIIAIYIFIYLFLSYGFCTYIIFKHYINIFINIKNNDILEGFSYQDKKKIQKMINLKSTWINISISTLLPTIFSFINILIWLSIYYRIDYRIYCSFNKEIRKELRTQRKKNKEFKQLQETNSINEEDKNKEKSNQNNFASVIIEKVRHPNSRKIITSGYNNNNENSENQNPVNLIYKNKKKDKDYNQSIIISSDRNFEKSSNQMKQ